MANLSTTKYGIKLWLHGCCCWCCWCDALVWIISASQRPSIVGGGGGAGDALWQPHIAQAPTKWTLNNNKLQFETIATQTTNLKCKCNNPKSTYTKNCRKNRGKKTKPTKEPVSVENCALAIVANKPGGGAMGQRGLLCDNQLSISCVRNHESPKEQNKTINSATRITKHTLDVWPICNPLWLFWGYIVFQSNLSKPFQSHLCRPLVASCILHLRPSRHLSWSCLNFWSEMQFPIVASGAVVTLE